MVLCLVDELVLGDKLLEYRVINIEINIVY